MTSESVAVDPCAATSMEQKTRERQGRYEAERNPNPSPLWGQHAGPGSGEAARPHAPLGRFPLSPQGHSADLRPVALAHASISGQFHAVMPYIGIRRSTQRRTMKRLGLVALVGYIATIVLANWALTHVGTPSPFPGAPHTLPVGFGLTAPSGVYFVALALVLRNVVQRQLGRRIAVGAIIVGALLSTLTSAGDVALASGVAFLCSEGLDMLIYTPLRRYGQIRAVLPASLVGGVIDSLVFLAIAFHSEAFLKGQVLGKTWGVLIAATILAAVPWVTERLSATPEVVPA